MQNKLKSSIREAKKRAFALTNDNCKWNKFITPAQKENNTVKKDDINQQTIFFLY